MDFGTSTRKGIDVKSFLCSRPIVCHFATAWLFAAGCCTLVVSQSASGLTIQSNLPRSGGYYRTPVNSLSLSGTADPNTTRSVLVNGLPAQWSAQEGRWQYGDASGGVEAIVESGSTWKYLDDGSDQGEAWRDPNFDDSSWTSGEAQLGYGDNDETTIVRYGSDSGRKHMTTYFRHVFEVSDVSSYEVIRLRLLRDDGAVVYLNGVEVLRSNMPAGAIHYTTPAGSSLSGEEETAFQESDVPSGPIHSGSNVLAVEIHQASGSSSDISFDLAIDGIRPVRTTAALFPGINRITVQAFDGPAGEGDEIDRGFVDVWYDTGKSTPVSGTLVGYAVAPQTLVMQVPDGYLPGVPVEVRLQVVLSDGTVDQDLWDATAVLSIDSPAVTASTQSVHLYNGQGTAKLLFTGSGDFNLTAAVDGMEATRSLRDRSHEPVQYVAGMLDAASANWQGIVHVTGDLRIPAGLTLTIQPGTLILIDGVASGSGGADIDVQGSIQSLGTVASPIVFTPSDPSRPWGELHHEAGAASLYQHTQILLAGHSPGGGHTGRGPAVRAQNATIRFEHCVLADEAGKVMQASDSDLTFRHCVLARSVMGPEIEGTALWFEDCWITEMLNPDDSDGIYIHDQSAGQVCLMKGGVIANVNDDCIDTLGSDVTLEDLIIRDARDKGVSIYGGRVDIGYYSYDVDQRSAPIQGVVWNADQGPYQIQGEVTVPIGTTLFVEPGTNVFFDADHVAQVKDGAFMDFVNNTVVQVANAALYFELPGHTQSPGRGANVDGCIFWLAAEPLFDRVSRISQLAVNRSILPSLARPRGGQRRRRSFLRGPQCGLARPGRFYRQTDRPLGTGSRRLCSGGSGYPGSP